MARSRHRAAFWIAVTMAIASVAVVFAPWPIEVAGVPLIWITGLGTLFSILIYEFVDSVAGTASRAEKREQRPAISGRPVSGTTRTAQRE